MKNFLATALSLVLACTMLYGQFPSFNMTLQKNYNPGAGAFYNDCWGYTDENGREYAIFGSLENIYIVDITDIENEILVEPEFQYDVTVAISDNLGGSIELTADLFDSFNPPSLWRDFKTYGHHAYGVVDLGTNTTSEEGLLVIDMSNLPTSAEVVNQLSEVGDGSDYFDLSHNLFVDEPNGKLYAVGVRGAADIKIYDVAADPVNPPLVEAIDFDLFTPEGFDGYVHDIFVENNIAYCSHINTGEWAIWNLNGMGEPDFEPMLVAYVNSGDLQHNSWPTKDRKAFVFCEETADEPIGFIDVSNVDYTTSIGNDIAITYLFRDPLLAPDGNTDNIAHNAFIRGDYLYISYYEDGVQVFDISQSDFSETHPDASETVERNPPPRIAYLDTSPETQPGLLVPVPYGTRLPTWNNWGTYPYFTSDKIIGTDTEYGLFVMKMITGDDGSVGDGYDVGTNPNAPTGIGGGGALAVDLAKFIAQPDKNRVLIEWETESELHHSSFSIERSKTGEESSWDLLKDVAAKGNVPYRMKYTEYDEKPLSGRSYYRLRMDGLDASTSYSDIITVDFETTVMEVTVSPTLVKTNQAINIGLQNAVVNTLEVQVIDMKGQVVSQQQLSSTNGIDFELNSIDLPNGNYLLSLNGGNVSTTERISVIK